jgi:hypothetical protein
MSSHPEPVEGRRVALDAGHGASRGPFHQRMAADGLEQDDLALHFLEAVAGQIAEGITVAPRK